MSRNQVTLAIVAPCFDEEDVVEDFHAKVKGVLDRLGNVEHFIVFVDDGSSDGTLERLRRIEQRDPQVRVYGLSRHFGHQVAVIAGLDQLPVDAVIVMDADLRHPPDLFPEMVARWRAGHEVVVGVRPATTRQGPPRYTPELEVTVPMARWSAFLPLALCLQTVPLHAWGPQAHAFLGREAAVSLGWSERSVLAAGAGAFLADLDHELPTGGVVGDSPRFAQTLAAVSPAVASVRPWVRGWLAHAVAQDPGQGEISTSDTKAYSDLILVRTMGWQCSGGLLDPESLRAAARVLGGPVPERDALIGAAEKLTVLTLVEGALLDMVPLELDAPTGDLPSARSLMPPALVHHERRLAASLESSRAVLARAGARPQGDGSAAEAVGCRGPWLMDRITLPPPALMGLAVRSVTTQEGLVRITVRMAHPLLFRAAMRAAMGTVGRRLFPSVVDRWEGSARIVERTEALRRHLDGETSRLESLFP